MRKKAGFGRSKRHGGKIKIKKDQNNNDELFSDQEEAALCAENIPQMQNDNNDGNKRFKLMTSLLRNKQSQNRLLIIKIGNLKQVMKKKSLKISKLKEKIESFSVGINNNGTNNQNSTVLLSPESVGKHFVALVKSAGAFKGSINGQPDQVLIYPGIMINELCAGCFVLMEKMPLVLQCVLF
jgi:hypothetical protein